MNLVHYGLDRSDLPNSKYPLVGVTKTEPLRELVWEPRKDPDHERQEIYD